MVNKQLKVAFKQSWLKFFFSVERVYFEEKKWASILLKKEHRYSVEYTQKKENVQMRLKGITVLLLPRSSWSVLVRDKNYS